MTTIIGLQGDDWCVIGADSRITSMDENGFISSQQVLPPTSSKLISKNGYIIGAAGDMRAINILHHVYTPPVSPKSNLIEKIDQFITKSVVPSIRECFDNQGYSPPDKSERQHQAQQDSTVLIALKARIYIIDNDYSWAQDETGIYTIGTGSQYARAVLHLLTNNTTKNLTIEKATQHIKKALTIASHHDPYTGPPHHIHTQTT